MLEEKTICHKVDKCLEIIEEAFKTKNLDAPALGRYLHQIRSDAQRMEDALRKRKEVMYEAGIEQDYQKEKKKKSTPPGVNKIANVPEQYITDTPIFEMTVTKDGELVYKNKSYAGVLVNVERFDDIDRYGEITGQSQELLFGHPLLMFYAFQQLERAVEGYKIEIMSAWHTAMKKRTDVDPKVKEVLKKMANIQK